MGRKELFAMRIKSPLFLLLSIIFMLNSPAAAQTTQQQNRFDVLASLFKDANVIGTPIIVDCTLSDGAKSLCFSITTGPAPSNHKTGPYCPRTINTKPDDAGTWFINEKVTVADGKFIQNLAVIYDDDQWQMFNPETGDVYLAEGVLGCEVAGDPSSAEEYTNYCVECEVKNMNAEASETYVFPLVPEPIDGESAHIGPQSGVGLAFNGVKLDAPAPMHMIEGNHTLGLMDACTGHVNPHAGYHYHALVGCEPAIDASIKDHEPKVAVAMDGYDIYREVENPETAYLDDCNGHIVDGLGYHYHADAAGTNQFIGCFKAQYGCTLSDATTECDASKNKRRGPPPHQK